MTKTTTDFRACDTTWRIQAEGPRSAMEAAVARVLALEARLNAFDPASAVARLNREGHVCDREVATLVGRATRYHALTGGAFDIGRGALEHAIKTYIRGGTAALAATTRRARYQVEGDVVRTDAPLDLNGIAKGHIVDEAHKVLVALGGRGFVDGGGDIAGPTGLVAIASPYPAGERIAVLDTTWNIATSGPSRRRRAAVSHLYDPREGLPVARHDQVTVLAQRDCTEADVLATTLAILPLEQGLALVEGWRGVEALWVDQGRTIVSGGFEDHVRAA